MQEDVDILAKFINIHLNAVFLALIFEFTLTQIVWVEEVQQLLDLEQWFKSVLLLKIWSIQVKIQSQELRSGGLIQTNEEVDIKEVL